MTAMVIVLAACVAALVWAVRHLCQADAEAQRQLAATNRHIRRHREQVDALRWACEPEPDEG